MGRHGAVRSEMELESSGLASRADAGRSIAHNGSGWVMDAERPGGAVWVGQSKRPRVAGPQRADKLRPLWMGFCFLEVVPPLSASSLQHQLNGILPSGRAT